jgi:hypothetical protein
MKIKKLLLDFFRCYPITTITGLYAMLVVIFTYPVIFNINSMVPMWGSDVYQAFGNISSQVGIMQASGFSVGLKYLAETFQINVFLPYSILAFFTNNFFAYNFLFLASFVLSGVGMYLLTLYFIKDKTVAFIAGVIFAFSPFHFHQALSTNIGTMHQELLPFFILFLFKFFEKLKLRYFIALIGTALLIAITEHQLLAFTVIFAVFFIVYKAITEREILKNKKLWLYAVSSLLFLVTLALTIFKPLLKVATSENNFLDAGIGKASKYSMNLLDPISPPEAHSIWNFFGKLIGSGDNVYFVGFSVITIIVIGFLLLKKETAGKKLRSISSSLNFWVVETLVFCILAMGPYFSIFKVKIYLPYYLLYKLVPFYENIRTTGRLFVFALIGISILAGYALVYIFKKYANNKKLLASGIVLLIMLEFSVIPIEMNSMGYSKFYNKIGADGGSYKLLEIPGSTSYNFASYEMILQTVHHKELVNGMPLARKIKDQFDMQQNTPVIKQLLYTLPKGNDPDTKFPNPEEYFSQANKILNENNIGYITISKKFVKEKVLVNAERFIEKYIQYDSKYEDDYIVAYQITDLGKP